ncbi:hypothetical protein [Confluentibacter lentus]|uniref:hypothetical protein n=1 Tax=Confluentibacter lentus TaxID=1699412 RepID=UPI000C295973|nr:hypothetical protein [Confluentibacter lentus]
MEKKDTLRFGFGTSEKPGSSIWRLNTSKNGDVFLNLIPEHGNETHFSLHASGEFHVKQFSGKYVKITGPAFLESGLYIGLVIEFHKWGNSSIPPIKVTGKASLINWLGWPQEKHFLRVVLFYSNIDEDVLLNDNMIRIATVQGVKLFDENMNLHVIKEEVKIIDNQINSTINSIDDNCGDIEKTPDGMEFIHISSNSLFTIISHKNFELKDGKMFF